MELFTIVAAATLIAAADSPFACDRSALSALARKHHFEEVTPALGKQVTSIKELPDGYAFELPPDAIPLAAEWMSGERLCCPFLDITLRAEREHGGLWLSLTGRAGAKEFIKADFASFLRNR